MVVIHLTGYYKMMVSPSFLTITNTRELLIMQSLRSPTPSAAFASKLAFRVQGIPLDAGIDDLQHAFPGIAPGTKINGTICVSCNDERTQVAIIDFDPVVPRCLDSVLSGKQNDYQCEMRYNGSLHELNIDKNFRGLTQLYNTKESKITAEYVF